MPSTKATVFLSCLAFAAVVTMKTAGAGSLIWDPSVSDCRIANCSSILLPGTSGNTGGGTAPTGTNSEPFVLQVYAHRDECLRLDVVTSIPGVNLEMTVVAPNNQVFRNDNKSAFNPLPLVKINPTPNQGWYTVHISEANGNPIVSDFQLLYGRYTLNNPNCTAPTPPI